MTDYISREAAFNALLKLVPKVDDDGYCWIIRGDAATAIDNIPAADVRPVVLCRDCTYCRKGKASLECEKHTYAWNNPNRWVNEDDFCSWGVKREES